MSGSTSWRRSLTIATAGITATSLGAALTLRRTQQNRRDEHPVPTSN